MQQLRSKPYPIRGNGVALSASSLPSPTKARGKKDTGRQFGVERSHAEQKTEEIDQLVKNILGMNVGDTAHEHYWSRMNENVKAGLVTALKGNLTKDAEAKKAEELNRAKSQDPDKYMQIPTYLTAKGQYCHINKYTRKIGYNDSRGSFGSVCEAVRGNPFDVPKAIHERWENAEEVFIKQPLEGGGKEALDEVRIMHHMTGCAQSVQMKSFFFHRDGDTPTQCPEADLNHCFIVMDKAERSLLDYIDHLRSGEQHSSVSGCIHILLDCLSALTYMQRRGIIHGDINPANILLKKRAAVKASGEPVHCAVVCDYGAASIGVHRSNKRVGTPIYMSPQQYRCLNGAPCDYTNKTDTYALALSIRELLAQKTAIEYSDSKDEMLGQMGNMVMPSLPAPYENQQDLREWLNKMLVADEEQRFDAISMVACYGEHMHKCAKAEGCPHALDFQSQLKMKKLIA